MSRKPIAYLSGPMTGLPDYNFEAFRDAAAKLRAMGYTIINPAETAGGDTQIDRTFYFKVDFQMVMLAEFLFLLPGWRDSAGATAEVIVAAETGKGIYEIFDDDTNWAPISFERIPSWDIRWAVSIAPGAPSPTVP